MNIIIYKVLNIYRNNRRRKSGKQSLSFILTPALPSTIKYAESLVKMGEYAFLVPYIYVRLELLRPLQVDN